VEVIVSLFLAVTQLKQGNSVQFVCQPHILLSGRKLWSSSQGFTNETRQPVIQRWPAVMT